MRKKFCSLILALSMILSFVPVVNVSAETTSGTCGDNLTWTLDDEGVLTISGKGDMTDYSYNGSPFYNNTNVKTVVIRNGATNISRNTFYGCSNLKSITIPNGVTSIGMNAFKNCNSLTNITIPNGVTSIGMFAFENCIGLTNITIPNSITYIGKAAFQQCRSLTNVYIADIKNWCNIYFEDGSNPFRYAQNLYLNEELVTDLVIPDDVTSIRDYAFCGCSNIKSVTIPDSVKTINSYAFSNCSSLKSITLPNSITSINDYAFNGCEGITNIIIPDSVTSIGYGAFMSCYGLTSVTIPDSVTNIDSYAFYWCSKLSNLIYNGTVTQWSKISLGTNTGFDLDKITFMKFTITYNSNGGIEAPDTQIKIRDETLQLSDNIPVRQGYEFIGWATSENTDVVAYSSGADYVIDEDVVLYALWKEAYTISYNANGGLNAPDLQIKTEGETLELSNNIPVRTGYDFLGWSKSSTATEPDYLAGDEYTEEGDTTLYAVWQLKTYTVSYNANGGIGAPSEQTKTHFSDLTLSDTIPTYGGYDFLGWSETQNATTADYQAGGTYTKEGNTVLYAVWKPHTYTITYNANGGSGAPNSQIKTHDISLTLSNTQPTRNGYSFVGWAESSTATNIDYTAGAEYTKEGNATLYAVWREIYTVNYDANGGTGAPESQIKTKNVTLILSSIEPTREGYEFAGWATEKNVKRVDYLPGATYTEEYGTTLYAVWIAETYKVTYNANGGTGAPSEQTKTYDIPLTLSTTVPTRSGYAFMGWAEIPEPDSAVYNAGDEYTDERPLTLYAVWKKIYKVTYNANGGTGAPSEQTKIEGKTLTLSTDEPTREGYDFIGWAEDSNANIADYSKGGWYTNNAATTLYAVWDAHKYTVSYDANGGTGAPSAQTKTYGTNLVLSTVIPTKTGYDFVGWASNKNAANKDYSSGGIYTTEDDTTLYAVWELHKYTVAYNLNGGTGTVKSQKKTYGQPLTLSDSIPTREGYIFLGWSEAVDGGTIIYTADDEFNKDYDVTLFAVWQCSEVKSTMASGGYIMNDLNNLSEIYLFSDSKDARIYYTIDGTTPTINSTLFSVEEEPLISADMTLKAIAVRDNCVNSDVSEFVYVRAEKPKLKTLDEYSKSVTINFEQPEGTRAISVQSSSIKTRRYSLPSSSGSSSFSLTINGTTLVSTGVPLTRVSDPSPSLLKTSTVFSSEATYNVSRFFSSSSLACSARYSWYFVKPKYPPPASRSSTTGVAITHFFSFINSLNGSAASRPVFLSRQRQTRGFPHMPTLYLKLSKVKSLILF